MRVLVFYRQSSKRFRRRLLVEAKSLAVQSAAVTVCATVWVNSSITACGIGRDRSGTARASLRRNSIERGRVDFDVLQENGVAFIPRQRESLLPMNDVARELPIF